MDAVLVGAAAGLAVAGLAVAALTDDNLWLRTLTGVVIMLATVAAHQRARARHRTTKPDPFAPPGEPSGMSASAS